MKNYLRALLHVGTIGSVTTAAVHIMNGQPITAGNVVVPAVMGFVGALLHAAMPNLQALDETLNPPNSGSNK